MRRLELYRMGLVVALIASVARLAPAQNDSSLRLEGLFPAGVRTSVTEAWGTLRFTIENRGDTDREARVVIFYADRPDIHYGRDVWIPARAQVTSWVPVGPAPGNEAKIGREIKYLLYDRTGGETRPLSSTQTERLPGRAVFYRKREPTTALYTDTVSGEADDPEPFSAKDAPDSESLRLVRTFRHNRGLSESVALVLDRHLPAVPEAFDGVDQFVLGGNRLAADPPGFQALRPWVIQGSR